MIHFSYDSDQLHLTHLKIKEKGQLFIQDAVDMSKYADSIEWDIMSVTAQLNKNKGNNTHDEFYEGIHFFSTYFTIIMPIYVMDGDS